jgi:hypothetical protein
MLFLPGGGKRIEVGCTLGLLSGTVPFYNDYIVMA